MKHLLNKILLYLIALWSGFVLAISFMEAWLKFQADGITLEIGLSVGALVFKALNIVELFLGGVIIVLIIIFKSLRDVFLVYKLLALCFILAIQTLYLLPILDLRVEQIIQKNPVPTSYHHLYYVILEIIKVVLLTTIGIQIIKTNEYK